MQFLVFQSKLFQTIISHELLQNFLEITFQGLKGRYTRLQIILKVFRNSTFLVELVNIITAVLL